MVAWSLGHKVGDPRQRQKAHTQQTSGYGSGPGDKCPTVCFISAYCGRQGIKPAQPRIQQRQEKMLEELSFP